MTYIHNIAVLCHATQSIMYWPRYVAVDHFIQPWTHVWNARSMHVDPGSIKGGCLECILDARLNAQHISVPQVSGDSGRGESILIIYLQALILDQYNMIYLSQHV